MDIDILELKRHYYPLGARKKAPTENGCIENEVASKLYGYSGWSKSISVPPNDMIGFVLFFICECSDHEWKELNCPYSLFTPKQVLPPKRESVGHFAILGEDVALIAYSLMRWYGSIEVFNVLRREWTFNRFWSRLERKDAFSHLMID